MEAKSLMPNTFFSRKSYMKVLDNGQIMNGESYVHVENEHGHTFYVPHSILDNEDCDSASQFHTEMKVSRTKIVEAIRNAGDSVFSVSFNKKVDEKKVEKEIMDLYANSGGKIISKAAFTEMAKGVAKNVKTGDERIMVCKLCNVEDEFGRFQVIDLEVKYEPIVKKDGTGTYDNRHRQITQLEINWAIVKGIKYVADK